MLYDLETFISRREGDREPIHAWKWACLSLPFGMDVDYCETVDLPKPSFAQKNLFAAGTFSFYPGFQEISAFDCIFHEDISLRTSDWLTGWRNKMRDPETGAYALPPEYKYPLTFGLFSSNNKMILKAECRNCWPTTEAAWSLNYNGGNELLKVNINFSTDGVIYTRV